METHQGLSVAHLVGTQEQVQGSRRGLVPTGSGGRELFEEQCWNHTRWKHTELDLKTTAQNSVDCSENCHERPFSQPKNNDCFKKLCGAMFS